MDFLTKQVMVIAGFPVVIWHVLAAVAALVLLIIAIVGICQPKKKKSVSHQEPAPTTTTDVDTDTDDQVDEVIVTIEEDCDDTDTTDDEPIDDEPIVDDTTDQSPVEELTDVAVDSATDAAETPKKPTVKNYHISLRPDGKWQVKLSKGGKAIKLFRTQAEAIAFAKSRAKSQDGHITIHKVDGKIRKHKY